MSKSIQREEFLFHATRALPTPEARLKYLDHECAGDNDLKNRVLALIQLSESADAFFTLESSGQPSSKHPNDRRLQ
ncbi:MAG: hypothetical protein AAB370_06960 [Verrucomicrobiota bacterium]